MKAVRGSFRMLKHEQVMGALAEDSYREPRRRPDPSVCPQCGATHQGGRWTWRAAPADAPRHECPACRRTADYYPAGILTFEGPFVAGHREQILAIVHAREAREKADHPLQRVMAVEEAPGRMVVATTGNQLAHGIARAVKRACKGSLEYHYSKGENLLRARWMR